MIAPIVFFAFNRPEHTRQTLDALAANAMAAESDLHIFCDGPRNDADNRAVAEVRNICRSTSGFASVTIHEKSVNHGLAASIIAGINFIFEKYDSAVVFEDDVLASPQTLTFLNTCLVKYRNEPVVFNVSAWSPDPKMMGIPEDYPWDVYFIPRFNCWGWGTWKDRWQNLDWDITREKAALDSPYVRQGFSQGGADMPPMLEAQIAGNLDSWAVRADFNRFRQGKIGMNPVYPLIQNIGLDGSGVHCGENPLYVVPANRVKCEREIDFPPHIFVSKRVQEKYYQFFSIDSPSNHSDRSKPRDGSNG